MVAWLTGPMTEIRRLITCIAGADWLFTSCFKIVSVRWAVWRPTQKGGKTKMSVPQSSAVTAALERVARFPEVVPVRCGESDNDDYVDAVDDDYVDAPYEDYHANQPEDN